MDKKVLDAFVFPRGLLPVLTFMMLVLVMNSHEACAQSGGGHDEIDWPLVSTTVVRKRVLVQPLVISGRWTPREEVSVSPSLDGYRLASVLVDVGDRVNAGQIIARQDVRVLEAQVQQSLQAVRRAEAAGMESDVRLTESERAYRRVQRLYRAGAASGQEHDMLRAQYLGARAGRRSAIAALQEAQAQLDEVKVRLNDGVIRAPVSGIVMNRQADPGEVVGAQSVLLVLAKDEDIEFVGDVSQAYLGSLVAGAPAVVTVKGQSAQFRGAVRQIGRTVDPSTGYAAIRIGFESGLVKGVVAGSVGKARIVLQQRRVNAVDVRALRYYQTDNDMKDDGRADAYVMKVGPDWSVKPVPVLTGLRDGAWVEIRAGLEEAQTVVMSAAVTLASGERVRTRRMTESIHQESRED